MEETTETSNIAAFYKDKGVLITGGTGFIGKVGCLFLQSISVIVHIFYAE